MQFIAAFAERPLDKAIATANVLPLRLSAQVIIDL